MKLEMFAVHDSAANAFIVPFALPTIEMAKRAFRQSANDPNHQFCINSGDYTMFRIGSFDTDTGTLHPVVPFENLGLALSYKSSEVQS